MKFKPGDIIEGIESKCLYKIISTINEKEDLIKVKCMNKKHWSYGSITTIYADFCRLVSKRGHPHTNIFKS